MIVPFSVNDFIERAAAVYGERAGSSTSPTSRPTSLGTLTYAEATTSPAGRRPARRARHRGGRAGRDREPQLGAAARRVLRRQRLRPGARADQLPAAARRGRLHRRALRARGCSRRSRARRRSSPASTVEHRFVLGDDDDAVRRAPAPSRGTGSPTRTRPRRSTTPSGTTARPKGVQLTHRNLWLNATHVRLHARRQRSRRLPAHAADVPLQRLGHAVRGDRHGRRRTSCCARSTAPRSCAASSEHGVTVMCGAPAVVGARCSTRPQTWDGAIPGPATGCGSSSPAPRRRRRRSSGSRPSSAGSSSRSTASPRPRRCSRSTAPAPSGTTSPPSERAARLGRAGAPALGVRLRIDDQGEVLARSNVVLEGYWEQPEATGRGHRRRLVPHRRRRRDRRRRLPHDHRPQEGRHHHRRRERLLDRGRGRALLAPRGRRGRGDRRARREVGRDGEGARRAGARARASTEAELIAHWCSDTARALQVPDVDRVPRRARAHRDRQAAEVQAARSPTGRAATARSTTAGP